MDPSSRRSFRKLVNLYRPVGKSTTRQTFTHYSTKAEIRLNRSEAWEFFSNRSSRYRLQGRKFIVIVMFSLGRATRIAAGQPIMRKVLPFRSFGRAGWPQEPGCSNRASNG